MVAGTSDPGPWLHSAKAAFKWDQQSVDKLKAQINVHIFKLPDWLPW